MPTEENIIQALYRNQIDIEEFSSAQEPEYKALVHAASVSHDRLAAALGEENAGLLNTFIDCQADLSGADCLDSFMAGWHLGARFVYDTFLRPWCD